MRVFTVTGLFDFGNPDLGRWKIFYCREFSCKSPLYSTCLSSLWFLGEVHLLLFSRDCSLTHSFYVLIRSSFFHHHSKPPHFSIYYKMDEIASWWRTSTESLCYSGNLGFRAGLWTMKNINVWGHFLLLYVQCGRRLVVCVECLWGHLCNLKARIFIIPFLFLWGSWSPYG